MSDERELERHKKILEQIENADSLEELPSITLPVISSYLAKNVYFDNIHISQTLFKPVLDAIIENNSFDNETVKEIFLKVLKENYPNNTEEQYLEKYHQIASSPRIPNILIEVKEKNLKLQKFQDEEDLNNHKQIMKEIEAAYEIKDLPKVGLSELNTKILRAFNNTIFMKDIRVSSLRNITEAYLEEKDFKYIEKLVFDFCNRQQLSEKDKRKMAEEVSNALFLDTSIRYTVEEMKAKEKRKLKIYELEHEHTMDLIKEATRISQLPQNLTTSTLTQYLSGNTTIYKNDNNITTVDLKVLTDLLLSGKNWKDKEVIDELKSICEKYYENKEEAFELLYDKFTKLPRTFYLVEEINTSKERQAEFIDNSCSNVNVYFIPNNKSPIVGGRFYNCYINRVGNLDLEELLPLNLDELVPQGMDIDSIEWYIQDRYDKTFKAAGGIILNNDETIGNVSVFRPNDGKIGITQEEKNKYDELRELSGRVKTIIQRKKEETDRYEQMQEQFLKMQEQFLTSQRETDKELAELEAKIDLLTKDKEQEETPKERGGRA